MKLETKRLILRPLVESDFAAVHTYASNPENVKYTLFGPNSENETRKFIAESIEKAGKKPRRDYDLAIIPKESGILIGACGIYLNKELNQAEIGWVINKNYWQQGYGTELAAELIRFGFDDLNLHRIFAFCNTENYGSYRVMERNGMRREATFIKAHFGRVCDEEKWFDEYNYGILAEEWRVNKAD